VLEKQIHQKKIIAAIDLSLLALRANLAAAPAFGVPQCVSGFCAAVAGVHLNRG
jgi:hypothetical protein